jgi:tRNA pseudouridine55 synthase
VDGLIVIDKPGGVTSRDAVDALKRTLPRGTKLGHTGTLDPLATGVLVVCVGKATRLADDVQALGKGYTSRVRLGATSTSDDADGEVTPHPDPRIPTLAEVEAACATMVGEIQQVPPKVSALKIAGRRAHDLARRGEDVPVQPRAVRIDAIAVTHYDWPFVELAVECGKGTYIRSIARDLGDALGCGGHVTVLRRTYVGPFTAEQGVSIDANFATLTAALRPMADAVTHLPRLDLNPPQARALTCGQTLLTPLTGKVALYAGGELLGLGEADGTRLRPRAMFVASVPA